MTDSDGKFSILGNAGSFNIVAIATEDTVDAISGASIENIEFMAPAGSAVISPLTTLVTGSDLSETELKQILGIDESFDVLASNPFDQEDPLYGSSEALKVAKLNGQVTAVLETISAAGVSAGLDKSEAFNGALTGFIETIQEKITTSPDSLFDLKDTNLLTDIKSNFIENINTESLSIDASNFENILDASIEKIEAYNEKLDNITDTDVSSDAFGEIAGSFVEIKNKTEEFVSEFINDPEFIFVGINVAPKGFDINTQLALADASDLVTGNLEAFDLDGDDLSFSISDGVGIYGTLSVDSELSQFSYVVNRENEDVSGLLLGETLEDTFTVTVNDGTVNSTLEITVRILGAPSASNTGSSDNSDQGADDSEGSNANNDSTSTSFAPFILVDDLTAIDENATNIIVATVSGQNDLLGDFSINLSGNGPDDSQFRVDNGQLIFTGSANFEAKQTYQVQLGGTDASGAQVLTNLIVSVANGREDVSGEVVDGYVAGATIFQDLNNNNVLDEGEPSTITSATGSFILPNVSPDSGKPIKIITGFDIGTNSPIVTSLGLPTIVDGSSAIVSPLSSVAYNLASGNPSLNEDQLAYLTGNYFGVSSTSLVSFDIFTDDPIAGLSSENAEAAKQVFEANQFLMAITHAGEAIGAYLSEELASAVDEASGATNGLIVGEGINAYKKVAADALLEAAAERISQPQAIADSNVFQIKGYSAYLIDHDDLARSSKTLTHLIKLSSSDGVVSLDTGEGYLNSENLLGLAEGNSGNKSPEILFDLKKIPNGSGSGTISIDLFDGANSTRDDGERQIHVEFDIDWSGDGETANLTAPIQTVSAYAIRSGGDRVDITIPNLDADIISVNQGGAAYPASISLKLQSVIEKLEPIGSSSLLQGGDYYVTVSTTLPIADDEGTAISQIETPLTIKDPNIVKVSGNGQWSEAERPGDGQVGVMPQISITDAAFFENDPQPRAQVILSNPFVSDIEVTGQIASKWRGSVGYR